MRLSTVLSRSTPGGMRYTPDPNFHGNDRFVYTVSDGNSGTDSAEVTIDVGPVADVPVARDDGFALDEDGELQGDVLGNDSDADGDTLSVSPGNGAPSTEP